MPFLIYIQGYKLLVISNCFNSIRKKEAFLRIISSHKRPNNKTVNAIFPNSINELKLMNFNFI